MLIYFLYFLFISVLAIQYEFIPFRSIVLLFTLFILLTLMAGLRSMDVARDYYNYQYIFDTINDYTGQNNIGVLPFYEPGFSVIVVFFRLLFKINYGVAIMIFYAAISLALKIYSINKLSINPYLTLLFYFSYFFIVQEMTQIRIGLASAIFLISVIPLINGRKILFAGSILFASFFHYSAIFYLLLLFFDTTSFNKTFYIVALIASILFGILKLNLVSALGYFDISAVSPKIEGYVEISENGNLSVNVFNVLNLWNIAVSAYIILFIKGEFIISDKKLVFFLKCNILSMFLLCILSGVPAIALRINQLFSIAQVFIFSYLVIFLPFKKFNIIALILIASLVFYVGAIYGGDFLKPYKIIPFK